MDPSCLGLSSYGRGTDPNSMPIERRKLYESISAEKPI